MVQPHVSARCRTREFPVFNHCHSSHTRIPVDRGGRKRRGGRLWLTYIVPCHREARLDTVWSRVYAMTCASVRLRPGIVSKPRRSAAGRMPRHTQPNRSPSWPCHLWLAPPTTYPPTYTTHPIAITPTISDPSCKPHMSRHTQPNKTTTITAIPPPQPQVRYATAYATQQIFPDPPLSLSISKPRMSGHTAADRSSRESSPQQLSIIRCIPADIQPHTLRGSAGRSAPRIRQLAKRQRLSRSHPATQLAFQPVDDTRR